MEEYQRVILSPSDSILDAIKVINENVPKLALVCDQDRCLLGVITDGDIRRALLSHVDLNGPVSDVMCKTPIFAGIGTSTQDMLSLMRREKIQALPILDLSRRVVGIETFMHATAPVTSHESAVFLMAGGFGTRLRPLTQNCPKPLLKVGPRPLLESILLSFIECGFKTFFISVHYLSAQVKEHFLDGSAWGVSITYIEEESPLGTAGAMSLLEHKIEAPLIVMNGDLLTKVDFSALLAFHESNASKATMCVREYSMQVPYGVIESKGSQITGITEKPVEHYFVNAGIYVLSPDVVNDLEPNKPLDMPDLLNQLIEEKRKVSMFPIHEYWLDIGRLGDFEQAQTDILEHFS